MVNRKCLALRRPLQSRVLNKNLCTNTLKGSSTLTRLVDWTTCGLICAQVGPYGVKELKKLKRVEEMESGEKGLDVWGGRAKRNPSATHDERLFG